MKRGRNNLAGNDFVNQYLKRFSESVQNNEEAIAEFKKRIGSENAVPQNLALELLRKYSGDMNTFFQASSLKDIREGYQGNVLGSVSSTRCIEYERDGNKRIRCVGTLEDKTGRLSFTEFPDNSSRIAKGDLLLIVNASVGNYNDRPYLTISSKLEIKILEKSSLKSVVGESLMIRDLKPDMYDVSIRGSLRSTRSKENVGRDSVTLYSGILDDESGNISVQSWGTPLTDGVVEIKGASIKQFKEKLYLQIGKGTRINVLSQESGQFETLEQLSNSQSGNVKGDGIILRILEKNLAVSVCSVCQRVAKEGKCANHPDSPVERILRFSMLLDDGYSSPLVYAYQKVLEKYVTGGKEKIKKSIESGKESEILEELKGKIVMKPIRFTVYGFRGTSGTYMEVEELSVLDENAIGEEYQKTIEVLK
jgi:ssDNA-binding replication factor A large subunit